MTPDQWFGLLVERAGGWPGVAYVTPAELAHLKESLRDCPTQPIERGLSPQVPLVWSTKPPPWAVPASYAGVLGGIEVRVRRPDRGLSIGASLLVVLAVYAGGFALALWLLRVLA